MKPLSNVLAILSLAAILAGCASVNRPSTGEDNWRLVWSDEFNYEGAPDPGKWTYELGFVRNDEMQYYTKNRQNVRVRNGCLLIEAVEEKVANERHVPGSTKPHEAARATVTSASVMTKNRADWRYGRIEVRAKIPTGEGTWPAIWMLGSGGKWPVDGEIDIMENVGKEPDGIHANAHFFDPAKKKHGQRGGSLKTDKPWEDFHIYAIEWDDKKIDFFYDNTKYHTFDLAAADTPEGNPFRKNFYLLINLAIGGNWGGKLGKDTLPARYYIDYVRVFERTQ